MRMGWMRRASSRRPRSAGQVVLFLLLILVVLFFVVLFNFDLHKTLFVKSLSQNAGDAGALSAARWQGLTLNLIGDLNLMHAIALSAGDPVAAGAITDIQARLCYTGPMIGFMAAQQAAKNNGLLVNSGYTAAIKDHADVVRYDYPAPVGPGGGPLFPEPYPGCWDEYADMLDLAADNGISVAPENARFYLDYAGSDHVLLLPGFYEAVAGRLWCWFHREAPTLLDDYEEFFPCWWPPLPAPDVVEPMNAEIFGLGLTRVTTTLDGLVDLDTLNDLAVERDLAAAAISGSVMTNVATWYCYDGGVWQAWDAMDVTGEFPFPAVGPVRPQYDYSGADAATRSETHSQRLSPAPGGATVSNLITWTAAAKPFGYLDERVKPNEYGLVLPAYHEVRLIPVDASSAGAGGGFNLGWREHIQFHLPPYMASGPSACVPGCFYCAQLVTWENAAFRADGAAWLDAYSDLCDLPGGGGGGGGGGGTRRGH